MTDTWTILLASYPVVGLLAAAVWCLFATADPKDTPSLPALIVGSMAVLFFWFALLAAGVIALLVIGARDLARWLQASP